jgi:hypothetical protein
MLAGNGCLWSESLKDIMPIYLNQITIPIVFVEFVFLLLYDNYCYQPHSTEVFLNKHHEDDITFSSTRVELSCALFFMQFME